MSSLGSAIGWLQQSLAGGDKGAGKTWSPAELKPLFEQVRVLKQASRTDEVIALLEDAYAKGEHPLIGHRLASNLLNAGHYQRLVDLPSLRNDGNRDAAIAQHLAGGGARTTAPLALAGHEPLAQGVYVAMVKDEEDIILFNLTWHYMLGLRKFFLLDNGSTDQTPALIKAFEQQFPDATVYVLHDPMVAYVQGRKMSAAAAFVHQLWPEVQWIFLVDADEFICAEQPLHSLLVGAEEVDALVLPKSVYYLTPGESAEETDLFYRRMQHRKPASHVSNKVVARAGNPFAIGPGNHRLMDEPGVSPVARYRSPAGLTMREFPVRSIAQFINKVVNGGRAVEALTAAGGSPIGSHWAGLYQLYLKQGPDGLRRNFSVQMTNNAVEAVLADPLPLDQVMDRYVPTWRDWMEPILTRRATRVI